MMQTVESGETVPRADAWLSDLQRHYTTSEQRVAHASLTKGDAEQAGAASEETVFF
jgi:hypothetical protein